MTIISKTKPRLAALYGPPPVVRPAGIDEFISPEVYYGLTGTCGGCRRVSWLCRRDRRCSKYNKNPKRGYVAMPTGYSKPNSRK